MDGDVSFDSQRTQEVRARAALLGFDAVGIARADEPLDLEHARYRSFVGAGMHGEMEYLASHADVRQRLDGDTILAGAKSVVCLARLYQRSDADERDDPETARAIARYARGRDYHNVVKRKLRRLAAFVRTLGTEEAPAHARPLCDDAPILERAWAARAGLGFIGKNGLVIVPGIGSMVLLGEVVTTLRLVPDLPMAERCGSCTRCLDVCPTQAFARPFVLDPRRCVAYLTIEKRTPIPEELREGVGEHLFGCDDCQTVCPFNRARALGASAAPDENATDPFAPLERWGRTSLESLLAFEDEAWPELSRGTPLRRATAAGLARNAAIVLGNRGEARSVAALEGAARGHREPIVREAAEWALRKMGLR